MTEIDLIDNDMDLVPLLNVCDNEELDPLVGIILGKDKSGRISSELDKTDIYKKNQPDHSKYSKEIAAEIQKFGGHTIVNIIRGSGVVFKEIVYDVAKRIKVKFDGNEKLYTLRTEDIEAKVMLKIVQKAWKKMDEIERYDFIKYLIKNSEFDFEDIEISSINQKDLSDVLNKINKCERIDLTQKELEKIDQIFKNLPIEEFLTNVRIMSNPITMYYMTMIIARASFLVLDIAIPAILTQLESAAFGPIAWTVASVLLLIDIPGPAFRVTIPSVFYVAYLRQKYKIKKCGLLFYGRSGHGKTSVINAVANKPIGEIGNIKPTTPQTIIYELPLFNKKYPLKIADTRGIHESTSPKNALTQDATEELRKSLIKHNPAVLAHVINITEIKSMGDDFEIYKQAYSRMVSSLKIEIPTTVIILNKADCAGNPRNFPSEENFSIIDEIMLYFINDIINDKAYTELVNDESHKGYKLSGKNKYEYHFVVPVCSYVYEKKPFSLKETWNIPTLIEIIDQLVKDKPYRSLREEHSQIVKT